MNNDGFTSWDRLPLAYPGLHEGVTGQTGADCTLRCVSRIQPYELARRAIRDKGPTHPATLHLCNGLHDDYNARLQRWRDESRQLCGAHAVTLLCVGLVGPLALWGAARTSPGLSGLNGWPVLLLSLPMLIPLSVLLLRSTLTVVSPRLDPPRALAQQRCADCAAPLGDQPQGIDPRVLRGVRVGPHACPCCRRPWPLVPPPADIRLQGSP